MERKPNDANAPKATVKNEEDFGESLNRLAQEIFGDFGLVGVPRGADAHCVVALDLREAVKGAKKEARFWRDDICETCGGSGARPGTKTADCRFCNGIGRIQESIGVFLTQRTCPKCRGRGTEADKPCVDCCGSGLTRKEIVREILIPPGVRDGTQLRLQGEGARRANGDPAGDCYVAVRVEQHPVFGREGQDLICQISIGRAQATFGAEVEAPTLDGPEKIKIPPGTQTGDVVRLKGRGAPNPQGGAVGDLVVRLLVETRTEREERLRREAEPPSRRWLFGAKLKGFFNKLFELENEEKVGEE